MSDQIDDGRSLITISHEIRPVTLGVRLQGDGDAVLTRNACQTLEESHGNVKRLFIG